jgi:hypothetical protein
VRRLRVGVLDLVAQGPSRSLWSRVMNANFASIMPQVVATWCEEAGHDVQFVCYTGREILESAFQPNTDLVFISAFTQAAQLSYALSHLYRSRGTVTALGGPHARCYPEDAAQYFDYVLGFTDRDVVGEILRECEPHRPVGVRASAKRQPLHLPGVRDRWKFIASTLEKAPAIKIVPMIASLGCPYTCSFCIDSTVDYQSLNVEQMKDDLRFLRTKFRRPRVGWHDPNFGVRFDETLGAIEEAVPPGSVDFLAESSLSLLSEPRLQRLQKNSFQAMLPGIESWYSLGNKAKTGKVVGIDKVRQVADHVNTILRYIPYVQTNFVLGLDCDEGPEPFELTKKFIDLTPGAFPGYSLLSAFGRAAPLNLDFQRAGRVLPVPHHFLNNYLAMNVRPKNYDWSTFYDHVVDLTKYTFSWRAIGRRLAANKTMMTSAMNVVRAVTSERAVRVGHHQTLRDQLRGNTPVRRFFEGESETLPPAFANRVQHDLGSLWTHLPQGAMYHDQNAYLAAERMADPALA